MSISDDEIAVTTSGYRVGEIIRINLDFSEETKEKFREEPEVVLGDLLRKKGYEVNEINLRSTPDEILASAGGGTADICKFHIQHPPEEKSKWEEWPCVDRGSDISTQLSDVIKKLRATIEIWRSPFRPPESPFDGPSIRLDEHNVEDRIQHLEHEIEELRKQVNNE